MMDDPMKMNEDEFNRANFFTPDNEFAAIEQAAVDRAAANAKRREDRQRARALGKGLRAIQRALDAMPLCDQYATVRWIADRWHFKKPPSAR